MNRLPCGACRTTGEVAELSMTVKRSVSEGVIWMRVGETTVTIYCDSMGLSDKFET